MNESAVIASIKELEKKRLDATIAGDIAVLRELLGDDLRYVHASGADETRQQYLDKLASRHYVYKALVPGHRDFRVFGDVVLVNGHIGIEVISNGKDKLIQSKYLQVWAQRAGRWQMVAWQSTQEPMAL